MIVFKLRCQDGHEFDGWFRDGAAYERQAKRGQIACPTCGDANVEKAIMAPRVTKSGEDAATAVAVRPADETGTLRQALRQMRRHVEATCEPVGGRFAEEARRIHRGESPDRGIYGTTTREEARALDDEGIEVVGVPWIPLEDA